MKKENFPMYLYVKEIHETVRKFCSNLASKWQSCYRDGNRFLVQYKKRLELEINFKKFTSANRARRGHPITAHEQKSIRAKRRQAAEFCKKSEAQAELILAATIASHHKGNRFSYCIMRNAKMSITSTEVEKH